jgi:hypothetical protein
MLCSKSDLSAIVAGRRKLTKLSCVRVQRSYSLCELERSSDCEVRVIDRVSNPFITRWCVRMEHVIFWTN